MNMDVAISMVLDELKEAKAMRITMGQLTAELAMLHDELAVARQQLEMSRAQARGLTEENEALRKKLTESKELAGFYEEMQKFFKGDVK